MVLANFIIVQFIFLTNLFQIGTSVNLIGEKELNIENTNTCTANSKLENCKQSKKYFLYDVNPGEGFNLRRDIYIRIAPLIASLNKIDEQNQWILVLPPWGRIPHWKYTNFYFPWSSFFDMTEIRKYIPVLELSEFRDDYGYDSKIAMVFQLQHFPFDPNDRTWSEKIEINNPCEDHFPYKWNEDTKDFSGPFWNEGLRAVNASCMSLRGQASTLLPFLIETDYSSVMFDRAEVILWDDYGGTSWWKARRSLRFSPHLNEIAASFVSSIVKDSGNAETPSSRRELKYVGVHLRRRDFVFGRRRLSLPSIQGAAKQVFQIAKRLKLDGVFLASDATADEFEDFLLAFNILKEDHESGILLLSLHEMASLSLPNASVFSKIEELTEGQRAVLDQIICVNSSYFIGTPDSTFTLRIFEEREILGLDSDTTFNYLCPDIAEEEDTFTETVDCKQPTKWIMKTHQFSDDMSDSELQ